MKKIFLFVFFAIPLIGFSQSKLSYDLILNISGVTNSSSKEQISWGNSSTYIFDSSGSPIILIPGTYSLAVPKKKSLEYKAKLTGRFTLGGRLVYAVHKNLKVGIGASVSYFKATRTLKNNNSGTIPSFTNISGVGIGSSGNWDSTRYLSAGTYSYSNGLNSEDKFQFVTLDIPLSINYSIAKWQFEAGVITSFIVSSSKKTLVKGNFDPETSPAPFPSNPFDPQPSPENQSKSFFSISVSPQYQLSNKLKIGIEYIHALTNIYSTNWYSKETYPGMKTSSLGLKILYKLK